MVAGLQLSNTNILFRVHLFYFFEYNFVQVVIVRVTAAAVDAPPEELVISWLMDIRFHSSPIVVV